MLQIFIEDSDQSKHPKNVKSTSNTTGSHLVCCHAIPIYFFYYLIHFYVFQLFDETELL